MVLARFFLFVSRIFNITTIISPSLAVSFINVFKSSTKTFSVLKAFFSTAAETFVSGATFLFICLYCLLFAFSRPFSSFFYRGEIGRNGSLILMFSCDWISAWSVFGNGCALASPLPVLLGGLATRPLLRIFFRCWSWVSSLIRNNFLHNPFIAEVLVTEQFWFAHPPTWLLPVNEPSFEHLPVHRLLLRHGICCFGSFLRWIILIDDCINSK